jgi:exopolyphosphatase / guanosine-5'-triphosphate,3'-diphosphate pyrophosphatase
MQDNTQLAAIDIGSNSFRLEIARYVGGHIEPLDSLRETVRLGGGMSKEKELSLDSMSRGWSCLERFAERIRGFESHQVRVVATQTLREAANRDVFITTAKKILGHQVEVIAGHEEARLIFQGVQLALPDVEEKRLVVDIGGRSTEIILGNEKKANTLASFNVGSVSWSDRYFPVGILNRTNFDHAIVAAQAVLEEAQARFSSDKWDAAYGASGTVGAVSNVLTAAGLATDGITRDDLHWLINQLCKARHFDEIDLQGLKQERKSVIAGGISVLYASMTLFDIDILHPTKGALRHGALAEIVNRETAIGDVRLRTVKHLMDRFRVDVEQAERVERIALQLLDNIDPSKSIPAFMRLDLQWTALLHELGSLISHADSPMHGAYLLDHVEAPGFSIDEFHRLAVLVLGQRGKLRRVSTEIGNMHFRSILLCLRLSCILCHARRDPDLKGVRLESRDFGFHLTLPSTWRKAHPQSMWLIEGEVQSWQRYGAVISVAM